MPKISELQISGDDYKKHIVMQVYNQLTINETRLFMLGVGRLKQCMPMGRTHEIHIPANELVSYFGGNKGYYSELSRICQKLSSRKLLLDGVHHNVFSYIRFSGEDGGLYLRFNPLIVRQLLYAEQRIALQLAFRLKSIYAIRLLEFLLYYINSPQLAGSSMIAVRLSLDDFKKYIGVPDTSTYRQITNIINKIINHSIVAIHQNTGYHITYQSIKSGRRVTGFMFTIASSDGYKMEAKN